MMAQGIIGGATSYEEQSTKDILEDITGWIEYTKDTTNLIEEGIRVSKENNYWNIVPFDFSTTLFSTLKCQETFLHDFELIIKSINEDKITEREVNLLRKIGKKSIELNHEYGKTYKKEDRWKDYGNPKFRVIESLYEKGRDYFVTLQDANNASFRLEDYIKKENIMNITQHISGDGHTVAGVVNGDINVNNSKSNSEELIKMFLDILNKSDIPKEEKEKATYYVEEIKKAEIEKKPKFFMTGLLNSLGNVTTLFTATTGLGEATKNLMEFFGNLPQN
jgi:hypothetical protein